MALSVRTWIAVPFQWRDLLQELLQTWAFSLAIAGLLVGFEPERPFLAMAAHSVFIGTITWAVIDLGRHFFASSAETGWPKAWIGLLLVAGGIAAGFYFGTLAADALCRSMGWYSEWRPIHPEAQWRRALLVSVIAGIVGTLYFYLRSASSLHAKLAQDARQHAAESRLKLLEAQLEPHMLFNTLANLRALIGVDPARAQTMLDHLHDYLRATLQASRATRHELGTEFDRLADYLALMQIRLGPRLQHEFDLPPALRSQLVPTLLLQPLVENAIKHGLEPHPQGGRIRVQARTEGSQLVLEVLNTGVGLSQSAESPARSGTRFGLQQVRERLSATYGNQSSLSLRTEADAPPHGETAEPPDRSARTSPAPTRTYAQARLPLRATTPAGALLPDGPAARAAHEATP